MSDIILLCSVSGWRTMEDRVCAGVLYMFTYLCLYKACTRYILYIILNGYGAKCRPYNKQCENKIYGYAFDIHKHVQQ